MMLFKPTYCCSCGEKIDRLEWRLWTSRKFCEVCESVHSGNELIPRVGIGIAILFGIFGLGSLLNDGPESLAETQPVRFASVPQGVETKSAGTQKSADSAKSESQFVLTDADKNDAVAKAADAVVVERPDPVAERTYFCGARTKKGTACSRRVKEKGRCWQHAGQAAMNSNEEGPEEL